MADATPNDLAAVTGEECHIVAQSPRGPRADAAEVDVDNESNLILLCSVDHKRVDDQPVYYSVDRLNAMKLAHESWVHSCLSTTPPPQINVRIRPKDNAPAPLRFISSGVDLLALTTSVMGYDFSHDEIETEADVELLSDFLQSLQDYGEAGDDLEQSGRVRASFELGNMTKALLDAGWIVYGGKVSHVLEGGVSPPSSWPVAAVRVKRARNVLAEINEDDQRVAATCNVADAS